MKISILPDCIADCRNANRSLWLWGQPGTGKTAIVNAAAQLLGIELVSLRVVEHEPVDFGGFPVPPDFDLTEEIEKLTNAADDAEIVVYDGCEPSQETIDTGIEIDWFSEWCSVADSWNESQWVEWFRKQ